MHDIESMDVLGPRNVTTLMRAKSNHGGARPGAGRPPLPEEERLARHSVTLSRDDVALARQIGRGQMSRGLRAILAAFRRMRGAE